MIETEVRELLSFIDGNPTAYHTTASVREILLKAGFSELLESGKWQLEPGRNYFVCRNGSSIIAFRMGTRLERYSFNVAAAHTDSPLNVLPILRKRLCGSISLNIIMRLMMWHCAMHRRDFY